MNLEDLKLKTSEIDEINLKCYDEIADEYGNLSHETCRDFDSGTICFLKKAIRLNSISDLSQGFNYLDIGVGTGVSLDFLMPWLQEKKANIEILDISKKMLDINKSKFPTQISAFHQTSIHNFSPSKKYDLIVGALCDPFLTREALQVIKKSLTTDGILIITLPTHTWAKKIRPLNIHQTVFHDEGRNKHTSFSFCWPKGDLIKYAESIGLYNIRTSVMLVDDIKKNKKLSKLNESLLSNENRVPMLLSLIFIVKN